MSVVLDGNSLTVGQVEDVARRRVPVDVAEDAWKRIETCRAMLEEKIQAREVMYGVTTGIGEFS